MKSRNIFVVGFPRKAAIIKAPTIAINAIPYLGGGIDQTGPKMNF